MISEYWPLSGEYQVVTVFSTETIAPIMEVEFEWDDVFDMTVTPAVQSLTGSAQAQPLRARGKAKPRG